MGWASRLQGPRVESRVAPSGEWLLTRLSEGHDLDFTLLIATGAADAGVDLQHAVYSLTSKGWTWIQLQPLMIRVKSARIYSTATLPIYSVVGLCAEKQQLT